MCATWVLQVKRCEQRPIRLVSYNWLSVPSRGYCRHATHRSTSARRSLAQSPPKFAPSSVCFWRLTAAVVPLNRAAISRHTLASPAGCGTRWRSAAGPDGDAPCRPARAGPTGRPRKTGASVSAVWSYDGLAAALASARSAASEARTEAREHAGKEARRLVERSLTVTQRRAARDVVTARRQPDRSPLTHRVGSGVTAPGQREGRWIPWRLRVVCEQGMKGWRLVTGLPE